MQKHLLYTLLILFVFVDVYSQDSLVERRIILIGDAGEMDAQQKSVITEAAAKVLQNKTTVLFLGDNVYPNGMGLSGDKLLRTQAILTSQFQPLREKGADVIFIPGNHDWDKMGIQGLTKVKLQWSFLQSHNDSLLKMLPANGCPDPTEINLAPNFTIIVFDSQWWLQPFERTDKETECNCNTRDEILARFTELVEKNKDKFILLASHHPFQTYGNHGGYYSFKDHIFPLTIANKNLYIPLPVIGSLYPILRNLLTNPQDIRDPAYKQMVKKISAVLDNAPNTIYAAGHEHGLQFLKSGREQIVSGSGAKTAFVKKGKDALYTSKHAGFVTIDLVPGHNLQIQYHVLNKGLFETAFSLDKPYKKPVAERAFQNNVVYGDSVTVRVHPSYNNKGKFHKLFFGEGYRKEWAAPTTLPVLKVSELKGGLSPTQRGGGMQSLSLRLQDKNKKEYVIRSVEKSPDALLPDALRSTFARDFVDDVTSAQHPFSAVVVPPIANAVNVPHANPVIGVVAADAALGIHEKVFAGKVVLFEEREPLGESDNTEKMLKNLQKDNDNSYDAKEFLRARLLDVLLGDWDRHADQWRWYDAGNKKGKYYVGVPRDRDQVFHLTQGLLPKMASRQWLLPTLQNFAGNIKSPKYSFFKTKFLNAHPASQLSLAEWMEVTEEFTKAVSDSVLQEAIKRLPASAYNLRHNWLYNELKERRDNLKKAAINYYNFINKKLDIQASDKNEQITVKGMPGGNLNITIQKINKEGALKDTLMSKTHDASITRQINIYTGKGNDNIRIDNVGSQIKTRIIGGEGNKFYNVISAKRKVKIYDGESNAKFEGDLYRITKKLSNDSANTAFVPVNRYNITMPLFTGGYNLDDGFILGFGIKHTHQGFRKLPYGSVQQLTLAHSFSTSAYRIRYKGEFVKVFGNANLVTDAQVRAPNNTQNFFGRGNQSEFNKTGDFKRYYRTRFSMYSLYAGLKWAGNKGSSVSVGPAFQYYRFDAAGNAGRFINNTSLIGSYDSATITKDKLHAGIMVDFTHDKRNSKIIPSNGSFINVRLVGLNGLNTFSKSFVQLLPEVSFYKSLNSSSSMVVANRVGGGVTLGNTTFYQSLFIGGHENLLGYRQYRFAGQHSFYNNTELRVRLARIISYILPGELGVTGFFDVGRVWDKNDFSRKWHNGAGGGLYFSPAQMAVLQLAMGHSTEGWYPYFTFGFRF